MSTVDTAYDLGRKVQELERELAEARQQQAGTSDILRIISGSSSDIARVFDAIARSAARLCEAFDVIVLRVDEDVLRLVAHYGPMPAGDVALHRGTLGGRTVIERRLIHIEDLQNERDEFPEGSALARERGHRTTLSVPLLKDGAALGNIQVRRNEVRLFSEQQISLLKVFADQAVIAIENTRLFDETKQALERQTATANILQIISNSPADVKPVFEAILENACRLCDSQRAAVFRFDGRLLHIVATKNWPVEISAAVPSRWPMEPDSRLASGRVVLTKRVVLLEDTLADQSYDHRAAHAGGWRRMLGAPMLRGNDVIGVIVVTWRDPGPILPRQVKLLKTFADQAVIAIENTRLFEAEQASKRELTDALEQQTATSDILGIISSSHGELEPVFG